MEEDSIQLLILNLPQPLMASKPSRLRELGEGGLRNTNRDRRVQARLKSKKAGPKIIMVVI